MALGGGGGGGRGNMHSITEYHTRNYKLTRSCFEVEDNINKESNF